MAGRGWLDTRQLIRFVRHDTAVVDVIPEAASVHREPRAEPAEPVLVTALDEFVEAARIAVEPHVLGRAVHEEIKPAESMIRARG